MVYIIECDGLKSQEELKVKRNEFMNQILEGFLLLPPGYHLKEVVKTESKIDRHTVYLSGDKVTFLK